jgi:hypothetical protein
MSDDQTPRLERLLESTARKMSGGALHPLEVLQRVQEALEQSARDGAVANDITIALNHADYSRFETSLPNLRREIESLLDDVERRRNFRRIGERTVQFELSEDTPQGRPGVTARFRDTSHRDAPVPTGATRRISRQKNVYLVIGDGDRVRVTHTPFTIGRAPGNDLVLPSLAVSRRHAELIRTSDGIVIRDMGSRNALLVNGEHVSELLMHPGEIVIVGDISLQLEQAE